jgi:hypothetical protein
MVTYEELLESAGIVSEESFNKIIKLVPEVELEPISVDDIDSEEDLCATLINTFLNEVTNYSYIDEISLDDMTICIADIDNTEELNRVYSTLTDFGWKIENYDDIIKYLEETENFDKRCELIDSIKNKLSYLSTEELENVYEELKND